MILVVLLTVLVAGGALSWIVARASKDASRWLALCAVAAYTVVSAVAWFAYRPPAGGTSTGIAEFQASWVPALGISFHLAADGLSFALIALTGGLGMVAVIASWTEITERVGFFHFQLLLVLTGVTGVFLAVDLFLLYLFWELMLVPMYFLIALWGHELRRKAAVEFFLFSQAGGLMLLLAIAALYVSNGASTGQYTFEYSALVGSPAASGASILLVLGFVAAFAVKLPVVPLHPWLPDAHTQASTAGSVVLAGLLLKTGAFGFLRFVLPLFPEQAHSLAPFALWVGVIGILYGSMLSFGQSDLKRLIAYTSVSHMGFVLIGIFSGNQIGIAGAVLEMVCHGLSTGALFFVAGALSERTGTRDMRAIGGLAEVLPKLNALNLLFVMASLGLPGLGNFVAEFLIIASVYETFPYVAALAASGMILSAIYGTWFVYRVFQGPRSRLDAEESSRRLSLAPREIVALGALALALVWIGVFPQPLIDASKPNLAGSPPSVAVVSPEREAQP